MMPNKSWKLTMSIFIVLCIALTQIEPGAFAASPKKQAPAANSAADTASPHKKSGKKKWIVILTAAAGVAVAVILATQNKDSSKSGTITVGPPTIG
jgi:hypothetical protein